MKWAKTKQSANLELDNGGKGSTQPVSLSSHGLCQGSRGRRPTRAAVSGDQQRKRGAEWVSDARGGSTSSVSLTNQQAFMVSTFRQLFVSYFAPDVAACLRRSDHEEVRCLHPSV